MRRLMELVRHRRVDLTPLLTHSFSLDQIVDAYTLFKEQCDDVLKVLIRTAPAHGEKSSKNIWPPFSQKA